MSIFVVGFNNLRRINGKCEQNDVRRMNGKHEQNHVRLMNGKFEQNTNFGYFFYTSNYKTKIFINRVII